MTEKPADYHPADNWYLVQVQHDEYTLEDLYQIHYKDVSMHVYHALSQGALSVKVSKV